MIKKKKYKKKNNKYTNLIFQGNITEQIRHGFLIMNATNGLANQNGNVNSFDFMTLQFLDLMWNGIGNNDLNAKRINKLVDHRIA